MSQPLYTTLKLLFTQAGANVSESILPDLLSFSYKDKETNEADEISLTLKDENGKWAGLWQPNGGEVVQAFIQSGTTDRRGAVLPCGRFYVDSQSVSGSPRTYNLTAVSIPLNKPIRKKIKSRAWESKKLKEIAQQIATDNELKLLWDATDATTFDRIEQTRESDLKFLLRLCEEAGLSLKVTDAQLVIFDQNSYEKKTPVKTIELGVSDILSWSFNTDQSEKYKSVTIAYRDPKAKAQGAAGSHSLNADGTQNNGKNAAVLEYTYTDPDADENGQEFAYKTRVKSLDEAKRKAKAKLRELNKRAIVGSLSLIGDVSLVAGVVVKCKGFGSFDGNFIVEEAEHNISGSGYVTSLSLRRVNTKY